MKPIVASTGKHVIILSIRVELDANLLYQVLAASEEASEVVRDSMNYTPLTGMQIEDIVRRDLARLGQQHFAHWQENEDHHEVIYRLGWADQQIHRHWPKMAAEIPED